MECNIYGITYEIKEIAESEFYNNKLIIDIESPEDKEELNMGRCLNGVQVILINKDLKPDGKRVTLIHELAHAIMYTLGYYEEMKEESIVQFMAIHHKYIDDIVKEWERQNGKENNK